MSQPCDVNIAGKTMNLLEKSCEIRKSMLAHGWSVSSQCYTTSPVNGCCFDSKTAYICEHYINNKSMITCYS